MDELNTERQRAEQAERSADESRQAVIDAMTLSNEADAALRLKLLSALAAIEKHNQKFYSNRAVRIEIDLSPLRKHDAELKAQWLLELTQRALEESERGLTPGDTPEELGKLVRAVWIKWAREQPNPKPSWLTEWEQLSEPEKEVDRRIGSTIAGVTNTNLRNALMGQRKTT